MKQFTTKIVYAYLAYSNLKRTPPREYPDTNEMVITVDEILPALKEHSGEFITLSKQADEINADVTNKKITQDEGQEKLVELQKILRVYEDKDALEEVTIELSSSAWSIFSSQFERWGKGKDGQGGWFNKIEDFVAFSKDIKKVN